MVTEPCWPAGPLIGPVPMTLGLCCEELASDRPQNQENEKDRAHGLNSCPDAPMALSFLLIPHSAGS